MQEFKLALTIAICFGENQEQQWTNVGQLIAHCASGRRRKGTTNNQEVCRNVAWGIINAWFQNLDHFEVTWPFFGDQLVMAWW